MNASSLLMVIKSRTLGMLCSVTFSDVSKAAAITGSAEFFAPLIATVPRSAFPPLIRNLSIHSLFVEPASSWLFWSAAARCRFSSLCPAFSPTWSDVAIFPFPIFLCVLCVSALCSLSLIPAVPSANLLSLPSVFSSPPPPRSSASASPVQPANRVSLPAERVPPQTHFYRALRILAEASGKSVSAAEHALRAARHDLRVALVMLKLRIGAGEAKKRLKGVRGDLRKALRE